MIERAINGDAEVYKSKTIVSTKSQSSNNQSVTHLIYTHLMNGVSHMLPFVVGGGILIALAFLIDSIGVDLSLLSPEESANFGTILPAAAVLNGIGGLEFGLMLHLLEGYLGGSISA